MSLSHLRLALAALAIAVAACGERTPAAAPAPAALEFVTLDQTAQQHAGVRVAVVTTAARAEQTEAPGLIALDERRTARIGSLVEGIVLDTSAEVGDRVRRGQVLAAMHSTVVHEAWAGYRKASAERRRLEKELAFAIAAQERTRRLYADKAISSQEVQRAEADRVAAEELLDMGRTEVRRSEEELEHLGITNAEDPSGESGEQIPVRTPISGVVLERYVTPGTAVTPGTPLFVVSDLSALWALVEIDESLLSHVRVGQPMQLRVAAYPDETFAGTVALVGDTVNPRTRRVTVRCVMTNTDGRLKPQMYATAVIRDREPRPAVVVPMDAIQTINGRPTIFVAESEGRFRPRAVDTGAAIDGMVEVRSGLRAGEQIVVAGSFVLKSELLKPAASEE
jgi:cobalt-zinc-cadmium efflux system membrane fusion protein